ncbi:unnamed protein product [Paramecium sonneborni]|uniref:Transmembrane protein n=1 Tax=Paramecium sonneborni TaxID=65129 RepID=A0A8S1RRF8_9CILI|nr:unnamed protein product [Paramecium sonneborni]
MILLSKFSEGDNDAIDLAVSEKKLINKSLPYVELDFEFIIIIFIIVISNSIPVFQTLAYSISNQVLNSAKFYKQSYLTASSKNLLGLFNQNVKRILNNSLQIYKTQQHIDPEPLKQVVRTVNKLSKFYQISSYILLVSSLSIQKKFKYSLSENFQAIRRRSLNFFGLFISLCPTTPTSQLNQVIDNLFLTQAFFIEDYSL